MTKILVVGDTHGDKGLAFDLTRHAHETDHDMIIQLGDFGFGWAWVDFPDDYPGHKLPRPRHVGAEGAVDQWLHEVGESAKEFNLPWWFVDGNHDHHPLLWRTSMPDLVTYMPRGHVATLNGVNLGFLGGAVSVDKDWRKAGKSWWATEEISDDELELAKTNFVEHKPTIVFSHDAPISFPCLKHGIDDADLPRFWPAGALRDSARHRERIQTLLDVHKPELWMHGHYHYRYNAMVNGTLAIGLANVDGAGVLEGTTTLWLENGEWTIASPGR